MQLVKVLYCKLQTNGKQVPAFPLEVGPGFELRSQRWEAPVFIKQVLATVKLSHQLKTKTDFYI